MMVWLLSPIGRWVGGILVVALMAGGLYLWGRIDGNLACITKNVAQVNRMERYVKNIRDRIDRNEPITPDLLRDDPFKRPRE